MKTTCQMCGKKGLCSMVKCDTTHLHAKDKLTGHQGKAVLSVCWRCEKWYKVL